MQTKKCILMTVHIGGFLFLAEFQLSVPQQASAVKNKR